MLRLEKNCRIDKMSPALAVGMFLLHSVYLEVMGDKYVMSVTSVGDGKHGPGSKHYPDPVTGLVNALDSRIRDLDGKEELSEQDRVIGARIVKRFKELADQQFDIVLEDNHIHLEVDHHD